MDLKEIKQLLRLMDERGLTEFTLERDNEKLVLRREGHGPTVVQSSAPVGTLISPPPQVVPAAAAPAAPPPTPAAAPAEEEAGLETISSPMVGTFYAAPNPDSAPYVQVGASVGPDTVVCIIEAMKIMNEIKAEMNGTIAQICLKNGQTVEFGQALFKVRVS